MNTVTTMKNNKKILSAILALTLVPMGVALIFVQPSFADTTVSKSISGIAAEKLIKAAYAKNSEHSSKLPYTINSTQYNKDKSTKTEFYSADSLGNIYSNIKYGAETILVSQEYYTTEHEELNPQEIAIATELGLNTKAKFAHIKITDFEPTQTLKEWQETLRLSASINFSQAFPLAGMMKLYPKSKLTLKTDGIKKTITFSNSQLGSRDVWTITNGLITSYIIYNAKNKVEYKVSFKTSAAAINPPEGPYFELGILLADPKFKASQG